MRKVPGRRESRKSAPTVAEFSLSVWWDETEREWKWSVHNFTKVVKAGKGGEFSPADAIKEARIALGNALLR